MHNHIIIWIYIFKWIFAFQYFWVLNFEFRSHAVKKTFIYICPSERESLHSLFYTFFYWTFLLRFWRVTTDDLVSNTPCFSWSFYLFSFGPCFPAPHIPNIFIKNLFTGFICSVGCFFIYYFSIKLSNV